MTVDVSSLVLFARAVRWNDGGQDGRACSVHLCTHAPTSGTIYFIGVDGYDLFRTVPAFLTIKIMHRHRFLAPCFFRRLFSPALPGYTP